MMSVTDQPGAEITEARADTHERTIELSEVLDSATPWVAEHTRRYVETNGEDGHIWNGATCLVLTTRGRKSGRLRRMALIYSRDGDDYVLVASAKGRPNHPQWYLNLMANPEVEIQVGAERLKVRARTAAPDEKERLWPKMTEIWPDYVEYQANTTREIPLVILERVG
jgi:deazaflavin-dependent oxidoreductase (nitroreductase family)